MRSIVIAALAAVFLLPVAAFAQAVPQTAAAVAGALPSTAAESSGGITREEYIRRAEERAGRRAAGQFDGMDTNHDGFLDPAEMRVWRSQHSRQAQPQSDQPRPQ
jgi:hypothetical protein